MATVMSPQSNWDFKCMVPLWFISSFHWKFRKRLWRDSSTIFSRWQPMSGFSIQQWAITNTMEPSTTAWSSLLLTFPNLVKTICLRNIETKTFASTSWKTDANFHKLVEIFSCSYTTSTTNKLYWNYLWLAVTRQWTHPSATIRRVPPQRLLFSFTVLSPF